MIQTIGQYLVQRLHEHGIQHIFGVPGDFILSFYKELENSPIKIINTCDEQGAGFAADAYARLKGLSAVCITYTVGGLKVTNTTAEAFSEKSPVIIISGAPGLAEIENNPQLHHKVGDFNTQYRIFQEITVYATQLHDPKTAISQIETAFQYCQHTNQPVYIEIPRDIVHQPIIQTLRPNITFPSTHPGSLDEALNELENRLKTAKKPAILAGIDIHRQHAQDPLIKLAKKIKCPIANTAMAKSVISETRPLYLGMYHGGLSTPFVRDYIEQSDCLLLLGALLSDMNLGIFTHKLDPKSLISVGNHRVTIGHHIYPNIILKDFLTAALQRPLPSNNPLPHIDHPPITPFTPKSKTPIKIDRLMHALNTQITPHHIIIADIGDALFASLSLTMESRSEFISPAYYTSIGFAVPASIGTQCAAPHLRPIVLVGDGAFQMTGIEFSTIARFGLTPIIIILNNQGYGTERPMLDGVFNNLHNWDYTVMTQLMKYGRSHTIQTEKDCLPVLKSAIEDPAHAHIIEVTIAQDDFSTSLRNLTALLAKKIKKK